MCIHPSARAWLLAGVAALACESADAPPAGSPPPVPPASPASSPAPGSNATPSPAPPPPAPAETGPARDPSPAAGEWPLDEYALPPGSQPYEIAAAADGELWFTQLGTARIGHWHPGGALVEIRVRSGALYDQVAASPDGQVWFSSYCDRVVARVSPSGGIHEHPVPERLGLPAGIAAGPHGKLWFVGAGSTDRPDHIARVSAHGEFEAFVLPAGVVASNLALDAENTWWFGDLRRPGIYRMTLAGDLRRRDGPRVDSVLRGPDGAIWYSRDLGAAVGRIARDGTVTELPTHPAAPTLSSLVAGRDGALWYLDVFRRTIGRITPTGSITEMPLPSATAAHRLTADADGHLWFTWTRSTTPMIGRITPPAAAWSR
jgi:virginiamycin B lyase